MSTPRIISGKARGIRLNDVPGNVTRPITDMVKTALFNILGEDILDSTMLDLFGGTGSVGIEALSRGAKHVRFIDLNHGAVATIKANLEKTRLKEGAEVFLMDAYAHLRQHPDHKFDYIYVAPPQYKGMWQRALEELDKNPGWMSEGAWVVVQIDPVEHEEREFTHFKKFEERKYGNTLLIFYEQGEGELPDNE
ncbi:MAG TPA: 16S rRNA (guanine(966)-N(2))-methyltransferase RsmD [Anaerolineaceae bacterium]